MSSRPKRNNAQHQPLTTVLRNIIREYPAGGGILRELIQNADDSGATQLDFILDETTHTAAPLLHNQLAEYQGPALLAFNNKTFSEDDFDSLGRIGDSTKAHDLTSTGKFGRGFNSVYNWTDGPSILSGSSLLLLDPHESWSREVGQPGGPLYDFVECCNEPDMINQLAPFKPILGDFTRAFQGTVIRIPLRTAAQASRSKILDLDRKPTDTTEIKEVFKTFANEMAESLLFLRHISSITLKIDSSVYAKAVARKYAGDKDITESFSLDEPFRSVLVEGREGLREENFVMETTSELPGEKVHQQRYAITHHFRDHAADPELDAWARRYKLMPWVAVASPLFKDGEFVGRLFNILPLPVYSQQRAHLQALFSVRPDRASIHSGDDSAASEQSETKRGAEWNKWLFEECIVDAWITNLQFMSGIPGDADWDLWPRGCQANEGRHLGTGTLTRVFERIIRKKRKLLPTISGTLSTGAEVIFASELEGTLRAALIDAGINVVCPPSNRSFELTNSNATLRGQKIRFLTPSSVRARLNELSGTIGNLGVASRSCLLDYIMSDRLYKELALCSAPLLPMMDGGYRSFQKSNIQYRFNREDEAALFPLCAAYSINNTKLSASALVQFSTMMDGLQTHTNIRNWDLNGAIWYVERYLFSSDLASNSSDIIFRSEFTKWIDTFWKWIFLKAPDKAFPAVSHLWVLPLLGDHYRKVGSSKPQNLDISGRGPVAEIFHAIVRATAATGYPIYSDYGISHQITSQFREASIIVDCEQLSHLLNWLSCFPGFLDSVNSVLRARMVERIGALARTTPRFNVTPELASALRSMPFFQMAFHNAGEERQWISLSRRGVRYIAVPAKSKLPPLHHHNTIFIERDAPGVHDILRIFALTELPSHQALLKEFVIPSISTATGGARAALVRCIMKPENINKIGLAARSSLAKIDFVPVRGTEALLVCPEKAVDPLSPASGLYFDDENLFPDNEFLLEFRESLKKLGMISTVKPAIVLERLIKFSEMWTPDLPERLQNLFTAAPNPPQLSEEHLALKWIPAINHEGERSLCNSYECRHRGQQGMVGYAMYLTELDIGTRWQQELGWNRPPATHYILKQLKEAVEKQDSGVVTSLLQHGWLKLDGVQQELDEIAWLPGISGGYYRRSDIFLKDAEFHPYLDILHPQFKIYLDPRHPQFRKHHPIPQKAGPFVVEDFPTFEKLKEVQHRLGTTGKIEGRELKVFVSVLEAVASRFPKHNDLRAMKIPDTEGNLHNFEDMTDGDPSAAYSEDNKLHFLHPTISRRSIRLLAFPTVQDRFLEGIAGTEFTQDFEQEVELVTVIGDTLKRYSIASSFTEFLANAEDCGSATTVSWVADPTQKYPNKTLITDQLKECQGQALFCYNDGSFSEKDFAAVRKIGIGSKRENPSKIGRFGCGSMTMYHLSLTPSFISGEYFVIFDPEQKRLPTNPATGKRRKGMKLHLRDVRMNWPDQLRPFEGLFGFTSESESFNGTLFRFPVMGSRVKSELYSHSDIVTYETALKQLTEYYTTGFAKVSLTFLKNVMLIQGWVRKRQTAELTQLWSVSSSIVKENASHFNSKIQLRNITNTPSEGEEKWVIIHQDLPENDIPDMVQTTRREEKLQARCAIAAPVSAIKPMRGVGSLFLTLPTDQDLRLPVCISADLVVGSDRKFIPILEDQPGADWNIWILQCIASTLYVDLLAHLARTPGLGVYKYWPEYPSHDLSGSIDSIISKAVWKRALDTSFRHPLFPVHTGKEDASKLTYVTPQQACFNLLEDSHIADLIDDLLPRLQLGPWKFVSPRGSVRTSLQRLSSDPAVKTRIITPEFVLSLFQTATNCAILRKIWTGEKESCIEFMNTFLTFVAQAGHKALLGCTILPLADNSFGTLRPASNRNYLVPSTNQGMDKNLLDLIPSLCVHPGLATSLVQNLQHLNVSTFSFRDLPWIVELLSTREQSQQREGLSKVWSCFDAMDFGTQNMTEELLKDLPTIAAFSPTDESQYQFITLRDFDSFKLPVFFDSCTYEDSMRIEDARDVKSLFHLFKGSLQIDMTVFPRARISRESLLKPRGLRRFLGCIDSLAKRNGRGVEDFVTESLARDPRHLEILGKAVRHVNWAVLGRDSREMRDAAIEILRQLPILPSGSKPHRSWISARTARLAPNTKLDLLNITSAEKFVDWAEMNPSDRKILGLKPMSISAFLRSHTSFQAGANISGNDLGRHVSILEWLSEHFQPALQEFAVALDGNGRVCMANTLYDHQNLTFQAAFHHQQQSKFLHPRLRKIKWDSTIKDPSSANIFLDCITGIQEQASGSSDVAQVLRHAGMVFEIVRWGAPEVRKFCQETVFFARVLQVPFVPVLDVSNDGTRQSSIMQSLIPPSRLIKLSAGALADDAPLCWSQTPFFVEKPCEPVLEAITGKRRGRPLASTVVSHLIVLSQTRGSISGTEIPNYISSAKQCYRYLQDWSGFIFVPPDEPIWFNTEEKDPSPEMFKKSWVCTKNLCLGLEYDSKNLQQVCSSLRPFIELLEKCQVHILQGPRAPPAQPEGAPYPSQILTQFQLFREQQTFFDAVVRVGSKEFKAHRLVLCASSEFFVRMFSVCMMEAETGVVELEDISEGTVKSVLDFIYTGEMTPVQTSQDPTDEMESLLDLLEATNRFFLPRLKGKVERELCSSRYMRPETVRGILASATDYRADILAGECRVYIQRNNRIMANIGA